jgi:hypothetical protein
VLLNESNTNEFHLILNGAYKPTNNSDSFLSLEAITGCSSDDAVACTPGTVGPGIPDYQIFWSDPNIWPNGRLPRKGDSVTVESNWNLVLDIE